MPCVSKGDVTQGEKYRRGIFGECPRTMCNGTLLAPCGMASVTPDPWTASCEVTFAYLKHSRVRVCVCVRALLLGWQHERT